jgi:uncharacterized damage-inducible protein DinB
MPHPLIIQLRFARREFARALEGLDNSGARRRFLPMNSISWNIGHLANHEQSVWLMFSESEAPLPHLEEQFGYGQPASAPPLAEVLAAWRTVTTSADPFLGAITSEKLLEPTGTPLDDQTPVQTFGSVILRVIYHYWYHIGETMAIRQLLGHSDLPEFVGYIELHAPYQPS